MGLFKKSEEEKKEEEKIKVYQKQCNFLLNDKRCGLGSFEGKDAYHHHQCSFEECIFMKLLKQNKEDVKQ